MDKQTIENLAQSLVRTLNDEGVAAEVSVASSLAASIDVPKFGWMYVQEWHGTLEVSMNFDSKDLPGIALIATTADLWLTKQKG